MGGYGQFLRVLLTASAILLSLLLPLRGWAQVASNAAASPGNASSGTDMKALTDLVRQLQSQLQGLNARVLNLEAKEKAAVTESQRLRAELAATKSNSGGLIVDNRYGAGTTTAIEPKTASNHLAMKDH